MDDGDRSWELNGVLYTGGVCVNIDLDELSVCLSVSRWLGRWEGGAPAVLKASRKRCSNRGAAFVIDPVAVEVERVRAKYNKHLLYVR